MNFLDKFNVTVTGENGTYLVEYKRGEYRGSVKYREYPPSKFQRGVYLMTSCDMGDVIEWRHKMESLTSTDLSTMTMYIREHSLNCLQSYLQ